MLFYRFGVTLLYLAGTACLYILGTSASDGVFIYTLDDPYIHLSVAESILQLGYGVNSDEFASPSSSVLFPFLLLPFEAVGLGSHAGLILSIPAVAVSVWILSGACWQAVATEWWLSKVAAIALAPVLIFSINGFSLPFNGMEHSLHLAGSMLLVSWLLRWQKDQPVPLWVCVAIVVLPLLRFEGLALSGAVIAYLLWNRRWVAGTVVSLSILTIVGAHVAVMLSLGLPPLPSSVLTKSYESAALFGGAATDGIAATLEELARNLISDFDRGSPRTLLFAVGLFVMLLGLRPSIHANLKGALVCTGLALLAHIAVGSYGWFSRYEIYILGPTILLLLTAFADQRIRDSFAPLARAAGLIIVLGGIGSRHFYDTVRTPDAMQNIYAQQFQMHRLATDFYPQPVAVNDLGWVSYRNDHHVLDLWGLGSEEARIARASGMTPQKMHALAVEAGSKFAMIYDTWFEDAIPTDWCRMGVLNTPMVTSASDEVSIYLIDMTDEANLRAALNAWAKTLPQYSRLDTHTCQMTSG